MHGDEYFEYFLGDLGYLDEEMFIMRRIGRCEIDLNVDQDVIKAYNKMHVGYKVRVEWGIEKEMEMVHEKVEFHKAKCTFLFKVATILTNFLH